MPGVKGSGGPPPKRSSQRRRTNTPAAGEPIKAAGAEVVEAPAGDPEWHPVALRWFESLAGSGQSKFYEPSDYAQAFVLAEAISRELSPQPIVVGSGEWATVQMHEMPMKGATLSAFLKGCTDLLVSETSRRRAALELQRPATQATTDEPAPVTSLASWKAGMGA